MASLKDELKKTGPFSSLEQEAMLALMRTSDLLENRFARLLRRYSLTLTQYNVLRILRGEGRPLQCLEVAERMIQVAPAITRVIEQLVKLKFATKTQSENDRRVFTIELTPAGARLLEQLDAPVVELHAELMQGIPQNDLQTLVAILEKIRSSVPD